MSNLDSFNTAFDGRAGSCRMDCACGKTYFDDYSTGYTWEEGELEKLRADPNAVAVDGSVSMMCFEGQTFVWQCSCWHSRRARICAFLDGHAHQIAEYLSLEKKRRLAEAEAAPEVS